MNLAHLILFDFFQGASGVVTVQPPSGPWIVVAMDAYSAGPVVMDSWDAQTTQDDFSAGAVAIDG